MFDSYINTINSTLNFQEALGQRQQDLLNANTFGYKQNNYRLTNTEFGVLMEDAPKIDSTGSPVFMRGENLTKMYIDRDYPAVHFLVKKGEQDYVTRLGDFQLSQQTKDKSSYIGAEGEDRTYLTTKDGAFVMGTPIGSGPLEQEPRFKNPYSNVNHPRLGESVIQTDKKTIGADQPYEYGTTVPIDLTKESNGLILGKYTKVEATKAGIIRGLKDGVWVPIYKMSLVSIPNPQGLSQVSGTALMMENEKSGLHTEAPAGATVITEAIEKSNVNTRLTSYDYKKLRLNLNIALSLQKANSAILSQFQQLLQG